MCISLKAIRMRWGLMIENKKSRLAKRTIVIDEAPTYTKNEIKNIRKKMNMTQRQFSETLSVSIKTVEAWENGRNRPNGVAMRLLDICKKKPELLIELEIINQI